MSETHTQIDIDFARAWDNSQGSFSAGIANRILSFANNNNKKIKSALDICCGASNLLNIFHQNGISCAGTETRQGMIDFSKEKYPEIEFFKTEMMSEFPTKQKYDLITCNHDIVNYFENFDEWREFFKEAYKHLNNGGMFVFDYYTKRKLQDWNETIFFSSEWLDYITEVKSGIYDKTRITYTYYINYKDYCIKTRDIVVECYFENDLILEALKRAGFKDIKLVDKDLNPLTSIDYADRIHVVAIK